ncbi:hypothetical protein GCM10011594_43540 [Nakamurella endophytica]|uniref:Uncharacterized protein n=1 Tax=Nakamurella endophytica TaxID=1748367 RepID=A0A917TDC7_9ACTN|nr:hypothetical protein GCM10011594_43540 [Nakamurella endophytica]
MSPAEQSEAAELIGRWAGAAASSPPATLPFNPERPGVAVNIERVVQSADGRMSQLEFVGSPKQANQDCGYDYSAAALLTTTTAVLVVHADAGMWPGGPDVGCGLSDRSRSAAVRLPVPLRDRTCWT